MADLHPEARVYLQSRDTGEIVLMDNFTHISTTVSMESGGASIAFSNANDRAFAKRFRSRDLSSQNGSFVKAYLQDIFNLKLVTEINAMRRSLANDLRAGRVTSTTLDEFLRMDFLAEVDFMNRVWIDFRGRDGRWYAGFTGITSGVSDDFRVGGVPAFTVGCKDLRRLLQLSQIITSGGDNSLLFTTQQDLRSQTTIPEAFKTLQNTFSGIEDPAGVIGMAIDVVNKSFGRFQSGSQQTTALFGTEKLWALPGADVKNPARRYEGLIHVRDDEPARVGPQSRLDGVANPDEVFRANPTFAQTLMSQTLGYGTAAYAVDRSISFNNLAAMRKVIRSSFEIFGVERTAADRIIQEVASVTLYDFWCDAMGNLIFQRPRYDDLPNTDAPDFTTGTDRGIGFDPRTNKFLRPDNVQGSDFAGLRDHGRNYLIGDESLKRITRSVDESGLYTVVTTGAVFDFISTGALLEKMGQTGVALAPAKLQRLLGTRIFSGKSIVSAGIAIEKRYLDRAAAVLLRRLNAQAATMSAELVQRPDLQPGRTMLDLERGKLYYNREATNDFAVGEEHSTTVKGNFGHFPEEPIGDAWLADESFEVILAVTKTLADITQDVNAKILQETLNLDPSFQRQPTIPLQNFPSKLGG